MKSFQGVGGLKRFQRNPGGFMDFKEMQWASREFSRILPHGVSEGFQGIQCMSGDFRGF